MECRRPGEGGHHRPAALFLDPAAHVNHAEITALKVPTVKLVKG